MAFEGLTNACKRRWKNSAQAKVTEADLRETMREIRLALLEADVNFAVVKDFVKTVGKKLLGLRF
jgi:Signal recognition particle GTPase